MDEPDSGAFTLTGTISRLRPEIGRVLATMQERGEIIVSQLAGGDLEFLTTLRHVDPAGEYIIIERSPLETANAALLARSQCTFRSASPGRHIEFVAADPMEVTHDGAAAIQLRFPYVLVRQLREDPARHKVRPQIPLRCLADAGGVASFEAVITDLSAGGIAFLFYSPHISLEPGTVLKRCRIELPGEAAVSADLEVRYTLPVTLDNGSRVLRSGCRLIDPPGALTRFIQGLLGGAAAHKN